MTDMTDASEVEIDAEELRVFIEDHHTPDRNGFYALGMARFLVRRNLDFTPEQLEAAERYLISRKVLTATELVFKDADEPIIRWQVTRRANTPFPWGRTSEIRNRRGIK